jgi:hypothetical protein
VIVFVKDVILSKAFNLSARLMLYKCQHTMYCYFFMEHVDDTEVCASSFTSLPLLFRPLPLIIMMIIHNHRASF